MRIDESKTPQPSNTFTVAVVGLGYVGLPLALLADKKGYSVIGVDINKERVQGIRNKSIPHLEPKLNEQLSASRITATDDFSAIKNARVIVVCVPTPVHKNRMPNLTPLIQAFTSITPFLGKDQLIVLESTVNPGVSDEVIIPLIEKKSFFEVGTDIYYAHAPERINPGDNIWTVENIPRVVGGVNTESLKYAVAFYRSILTADVKPMGSVKEAESVKIVENAFRDINIAFVNELALSFPRMGINLSRVLDGASTKPFAFMPHYPGCGVGGHCIPVDPYYLIRYAKQNGFVHDFLILARKINGRMPIHTARLLMNRLQRRGITVRNTRVAVLGVAYKPNISDSRESPAYEIINYLKKRGCDVVVYDPHVPHESTAPSLSAALSGAKGVVIATAHKEFTEMDPHIFKTSGVEVVVDGRNCLPAERITSSGIEYQGIGT